MWKLAALLTWFIVGQAVIRCFIAQTIYYNVDRCRQVRNESFDIVFQIYLISFGWTAWPAVLAFVYGQYRHGYKMYFSYPEPQRKIAHCVHDLVMDGSRLSIQYIRGERDVDVPTKTSWTIRGRPQNLYWVMPERRYSINYDANAKAWYELDLLHGTVLRKHYREKNRFSVVSNRPWRTRYSAISRIPGHEKGFVMRDFWWRKKTIDT